MGQVESVIFEDSAPPWDIKSVTKLTDLDEDSINFYWRQWNSNPVTKKGKIDFDTFKVIN